MMIKADNLKALRHIRHGFFTRQGGVSKGIYQSLNCGWNSGDDRSDVAANRDLIAAQLGVEPGHLITAHQTHSKDAVIIHKLPDEMITADGLITTQRHLALGVLAADCAPVLLADRRAPICGAFHAGWRGAVAGISDMAIEQMRKCGAAAADIIAAIGPHISAAVYQTGPDMRDEACALDSRAEKFFVPDEFSVSDDVDRFYFDLGGYLEARLAACGVIVERVGGCTLSDPGRFFSYRASRVRGEASYGRQISAILLA